MTDPNLISVRTEVVMDTLIGSLATAVSARIGQPLDDGVAAALAATGAEATLARAGWHARAVELERFEPAQAPMPWLVELVRAACAAGEPWSAATAAVALELAGREPGQRPDPGDADAVSWRVPGPGGHVRHYLALDAAREHAPGTPPDQAKRSWLAGFLVHCCGEARLSAAADER